MPPSRLPGVQQRGRRGTRLNPSQRRIEVHAALVPLALLFLFAGGIKVVMPIEELTKRMPPPGW